MKKQKAAPAAPDVEQYLNFGSDHDNKHALGVWLEAIKSGSFPDPATPLRVFVELRNALLQVSDQPAQVIPVFEQRTNGMKGNEKLFIARHLLNYFEHTVFAENENGEPETYLTGISKPLDALLTRLSKETGKTNDDPNTGDLRRLLKETIRQEMERLPEYLQSLETKDRVNVLCKMMPYVFPKVESVHLSEGEPLSFL
jgi:hypothetical protein